MSELSLYDQYRDSGHGRVVSFVFAHPLWSGVGVGLLNFIAGFGWGWYCYGVFHV